MPEDWIPPPPPFDARPPRRSGRAGHVARRVGAVLFLLFAALGVLVFAFVVWFAARSGDFDDAEARGEAFGQGATDVQCLSEAMAQLEVSGSRWFSISETGFLLACLSHAEPTAEFCDGRPDAGAGVPVRIDPRCEALGQPTAACQSLFLLVAQRCAGRTAGRHEPAGEVGLSLTR